MISPEEFNEENSEELLKVYLFFEKYIIRFYKFINFPWNISFIVMNIMIIF